MKILEIEPGICSFVYCAKVNVGGKVPRWVTNKYLKSALSLGLNVRHQFQSLRSLDQLDAADGRAIAEILVINEKSFHRSDSSHAPVVFGTHLALRELKKQYPFMVNLTTNVLRNKLWPAKECDAKLCSLTEREGGNIGASFAVSLATNLTSEAAVDEWIVRYSALKELDREHKWFREMMHVIAKRLLGRVAWGLKMRVISSAGLSLLDIISDINVIIFYLRTSNSDYQFYGYGLLCMIVLCYAFQLGFVFFQNQKSKRYLLTETLIVLSGLKPGFDAYRVASGAKQGLHQKMTPILELNVTKGIEMFTEAIPGAVLQVRWSEARPTHMPTHMPD